MIQGKTREEALQLSANELSAPLGSLPPMKIHCGQMVEGALKAALEAEAGAPVASIASSTPPSNASPTLVDSLSSASHQSGKVKIVFN
jgi:nitrogen fixation NifU-like protein